MKTTKQSANGTSFHSSEVTATVNGLCTILGRPDHSENDGQDKVNFEWVRETNNGYVFTVYDYKEYRVLKEDEEVCWHIGGMDKTITETAKKEIEELLTTWKDNQTTGTGEKQNEISSHTQGQWAIFDNETPSVIIYTDKKHNRKEYIALCGQSRLFSDSEKMANTKLIAAAPDMLKALHQISQSIGLYKNTEHKTIEETLQDIENTLTSAINKTKGL